LSIELKIVQNKKQLRDYIFLPEQLYKDDKRWVPPLYTDEWAFHDPKKNKPLEHCEVIRILAYRDGHAVGRIMGIIHPRYNEHHNEKTARFYNLDCLNESVIASTLISYMENWAREKGMNKIIGPFGFSDKDPQGLQVEGFEYLPVLATPTNPRYLPDLVVSLGYEKEVDCVSYQMDIPKEIPDAYKNIYARIVNRSELKLKEFSSKRELKPYILPVLRLVNEAYAPIFGFTPMSEEEMKKFAAQYLPVLDPEFVKAVIDNTGTLIAFVVALPEMSAGIQKAKGRLFPFGFLYIVSAMRKTKQLNLMLGAVKEGYRRAGISVLMGKAMLETASRRGFEIMDSHLILENNLPMRGECEKLNGRLCKRYRIFRKYLS